jgi:hypothetical protein
MDWESAGITRDLPYNDEIKPSARWAAGAAPVAVQVEPYLPAPGRAAAYLNGVSTPEDKPLAEGYLEGITASEVVP